MLEAHREAHRIINEICDLQEELFAKVNVEKKQYDDAARRRRVRAAASDTTSTPSARPSRPSGKQARADAVADLKARVLAELIPDPTAEGAISPS